MSGFVEGIDRRQSTFFPPMLDDYVAEDNPVRAVDAFVDGLDLGKLGFGRVAPLETGRPSYHPATLLKIYIYGYLNRIPSSRRLERECQRNIELIWLTGQLAPDFKTIADFRKDNGKAIREVCRSFVVLCRELDFLSEASVAIDGSKFKAVNARDKNFTEAKMKRRLERIEESIARYIAQLETADRRGDAVPEAQVARFKDKIEKLREEIARLRAINTEMMNSEDKQISLTDPDARSMATSGKDTGIVGYNVQNRSRYQEPSHCRPRGDEHRHGPPSTIEYGGAGPRRDGVETLDAVADRGYYASEEIRACEEAGITVTLPKPMTSNSKAAGRFGKQDFRYVTADDAYVCPAGQKLTYSFTTEDRGLVLRRYRTNTCQSCAIKKSCTTGKERLISRWEHEAVLDTVQARLDQHPEKMTIRRQTAEHPFGTIKCWMGATHFLTKRLPKVATEMALNVLAYNMKRVMAVIGVAGLLETLAV